MTQRKPLILDVGEIKEIALADEILATIDWDNVLNQPDIDARIWPAPGENVGPDGTKYASITDLIAALSTGETGYLGARAADTEDVTITGKTITLIGVDTCNMEHEWTISGSTVRFVNISFTPGGVGIGDHSVELVSNSTVYLEGCIVEVASDSDPCYGLKITSGSVAYADDRCTFYSNGAGVTWDVGGTGTFHCMGAICLITIPQTTLTRHGYYRDSTGVIFWLDTKTANYILAGPTSGGAASPTFRALVAGDLSAIYVSGVTKTVKASAGDYTTIQGALDYFAGKVCRLCIINVDPGTYSEYLVVDHINTGYYGDLTVLGDTRGLAGLSYVDNVPMNRTGITNGGVGTCSLSNAGNNITVTGSTTNPNFTGWVNGDKVLTYSNAGVWAEYTISSVATNVITLTGTAPALGNTGTSVTLLPDRIITPAISSALALNGSCTIKGFYVKPTGSNWSVNFNMPQVSAAIQNFVGYGGGVGIGMAVPDCQMVTGGVSLTLANMSYGIYGAGAVGCNMSLGNSTVVLRCSQIGVYQSTPGYVGIPYAIIVGCTYGVYAIQGAVIDASNCAVIQNTVGYYSVQKAYIGATSTNALNQGNTTNYSPATSDTEGNADAIITWS